MRQLRSSQDEPKRDHFRLQTQLKETVMTVPNLDEDRSGSAQEPPTEVVMTALGDTAPEILKMLVLSTGHLPQDVLNGLPGHEHVLAWRTDYGAIVYANADTSELGEEDRPIAELLAEAVRLGCDYVMLDCDASYTNRLKSYSWDEDPAKKKERLLAEARETMSKRIEHDAGRAACQECPFLASMDAARELAVAADNFAACLIGDGAKVGQDG